MKHCSTSDGFEHPPHPVTMRRCREYRGARARTMSRNPHGITTLPPDLGLTKNLSVHVRVDVGVRQTPELSIARQRNTFTTCCTYIMSQVWKVHSTTIERHFVNVRLARHTRTSFDGFLNTRVPRMIFSMSNSM